MTWIKTVRPDEDPRVGKALTKQGKRYPREYQAEGRAERRPLHPLVMNDNIVLSHSLIPDALEHAFSTFGAIMHPDLPLSRRDHEMIAATVSALNRCFY
ncbi:MAG: hypothetical protein SFU56_20890 [Capsulimonadales bacterium]|nr:hypothetical protein [Capsulimonadales bacterium]